jgi:hypothetical protein
LMIKYPCPCLFQARPRRVVIQQRPPCQHPCCCSRCRPSPCGRLSRPRSTTAAPPHPTPTAGVAPARHPRRRARWTRQRRVLPTFAEDRSGRGGVQLHPDGIARPAHHSLGPDLPSPISHRRRKRDSQISGPSQHRSATHPPEFAGR